MKTYARIDNGKVVEIIAPMADDNGGEIAIERRFHPDFVAQLRDVTNMVDVREGWITMDGMLVPPPSPSADAIEAEKVRTAEAEIMRHLDAAAVGRGYDNILSAASYAAMPSGTPFQAEGQVFAVWRANCWARAYEILAEVKAGTRAEPTLDELIDEMPELVLP